MESWGNTNDKIVNTSVATAYQNEIISPITEPIGFVNDYKTRVGQSCKLDVYGGLRLAYYPH